LSGTAAENDPDDQMIEDDEGSPDVDDVVEVPADNASELPLPELLTLLRDGELRVVGRLTTASNTTLYATVSLGEVTAHCVYKPIAGERPLRDFPDHTLAGREVAAYEVAAALGWHLVPPTVLRETGPFGPGMCQRWIADADPSALLTVLRADATDDDAKGWLPVLEVELADGTPALLAHRDSAELARVAVFDAVINNADRKGGHLLLGPDERLSVVDHGICFHVEDKLRTMLWGFAHRPIPADEVDDLRRLGGELASGALRDRLATLISQAEIDQTLRRLDELLTRGELPGPEGRRRPIPWPPI
jgi:uncharacterized repeat protein (TIGR03843 family)